MTWLLVIIALIVGIVLGGGSRFPMHDPSTWPEQAALAASGSWGALEALQDVLEGGRRV